MQALQSATPRFEHLSGAQLEAITRFIRVKQLMELRTVRAAVILGAVWLVVGLSQWMMTSDNRLLSVLPSVVAALASWSLVRTKYYLNQSARTLRQCGLQPFTVSQLDALQLSRYDPWIRRYQEGRYTLTLKARPSYGRF